MSTAGTRAHAAGGVPPAWHTLLADFAALTADWQRAARGGGPAAVAAAAQLASRAADLWTRAVEGGTSTALGDLAARQADGLPLTGAADLVGAIARLQQASLAVGARERVLLAEGAATYAARLAADGTAPRSAVDLLALWIEVQDGIRHRALAGSDCVALHAELVNAAVAVVAAVQTTLRGLALPLALAPRAEVDALATRVAALEAGVAAAPAPVRRRAAHSMRAGRTVRSLDRADPPSPAPAPARRRRPKPGR